MSLHQLYRHFDQRGHLLYVGQSISALARLLSHKSSPWIADIAFVSIDRYDSAEVLNEAEAIAIATELPIYNKVQPNPKAKETKAKPPKSDDVPVADRVVSRLRAGRTAQDLGQPSKVAEVAIQAARPKSSDGGVDGHAQPTPCRVGQRPGQPESDTLGSGVQGAGIKPGPSDSISVRSSTGSERRSSISDVAGSSPAELAKLEPSLAPDYSNSTAGLGRDIKTAKERDARERQDHRPAPLSNKRGRPRIGEERDKPWIAAGLSERTWYRRKAEEKAK